MEASDLCEHFTSQQMTFCYNPGSAFISITLNSVRLGSPLLGLSPHFMTIPGSLSLK